MKRIFVLFLSMCLICHFGFYAQERHFCGTDYINNILLKSNSTYSQSREKTLATLRMSKPLSIRELNETYIIPVVVHIINAGDPIGTLSNPSDYQIRNLIDILNQSFSATYPGYQTIDNGGVNIGIQFQLAKRTPDCQTTNGIVRYDASTNLKYVNNGLNVDYNDPGINYDDIANMSFWDNTQYLNIWLVNKIPGWVDGFAFFPISSYLKGEGVYMESNFINNPYLIVHEIGHAFDLRHTFQDASGTTCPANNDCSNEGDLVCDTDPHLEDITPCNSSEINPCTNRPLGDLVYNYMNYNCLHSVFTQGQKERMLRVLLSIKQSWLTSLGGTSPDGNSAEPNATIITNGDNLCGASAGFFVTVSNAGSKPRFIWKLNNISYPQGTGVSPDSTQFWFFPSHGDVVICEVESSSECSLPKLVQSNALTITVNNIGPPVISISTNKNFPTELSPISFKAYASNYGTEPIYQWKLNGNNVGGNTSTFILETPKNEDKIVCEITGNSPCASPNFAKSNEIEVLISTGLEIINNQNLKIYPNPTRYILSIEFPQTVMTDKIEILDIAGKVMSKWYVVNKQTIDVSALPRGVFFVRSGSNTQKFIKQ